MFLFIEYLLYTSACHVNEITLNIHIHCMYNVELAKAVKEGIIAPDMLSRYLDLTKNPVFAWLMSFGYVPLAVMANS